MKYKIFEYDPQLLTYENDINQRMKNFAKKKRELVGTSGKLCDFANGHEYFGFHKTDKGWYYREWAPAAEEVYLTGDMVDSRNTKVDIALKFAEQAVKIAPCYYVAGNHEARVEEYIDLKEGLMERGVTVLEDEKVEIEHMGESVVLVGVIDPSFETDYLLGDDEAVMKSKLKELVKEEDGYIILLSHRPELFDSYVDNGVDLVFSGHAHGGQFRIPFIGGIVAPNQGVFPKYDAGVFTEDNTDMVVSRGVGNSIIPLRVNNRPEVVLVELEYIA